MSKIFLQDRYIKPFINSIQELFETMLELKITPKDYFVDLNAQVFDIGVAANIGISGKIKGIISLLLTEETALFLTSRFMDQKYDEVDDFVKSTIGELTNIIVGGAKKQFLQLDQDFKISIPTILIGQIKEIYTKDSIPSIYIPFEVENKIFYLKLCLIQNTDYTEETWVESYSDHMLKEKLGELIFTMFKRNDNYSKADNYSNENLSIQIKSILENINKQNQEATSKDGYYNLGELMNVLLELYLTKPDELDQLKISSLMSSLQKINNLSKDK